MPTLQTLISHPLRAHRQQLGVLEPDLPLIANTLNPYTLFL